MTHEPQHPPSTADIARSGEAQGRGDESMRGREAVAEQERSARETTRAEARPADSRPVPAGRPTAQANDAHAPLFAANDASGLRQRWTDVQAGFVDEPRRAVEHADSLVADVMKRLAESFAAERKALEQQWDRGDQVTTEDLRVALQRYRSFFDRLLSV